MNHRDIPCYAFAVRHASRHLTQFYDQALVPSGIRITQFGSLMLLSRNGPMTINALARELGMDRTTLGRNILPLERDGIISVRSSPADLRMKELALTDHGAARLDVAKELWRGAQETFENSFGKDRAANLREEMRAAAELVLR